MEQLPEIETGSVPEIVDGGPVTIDSGWVRQYTGWSAADLRLQSEALMLKSVTLARDLGTTRLDVGEGTVIGQGNVDQIPKSENNPLYSVQVKQGEFRQLFLERERYPELYASYDEAVWLRSEAHRREHAHK